MTPAVTPGVLAQPGVVAPAAMPPEFMNIPGDMRSRPPVGNGPVVMPGVPIATPVGVIPGGVPAGMGVGVVAMGTAMGPGMVGSGVAGVGGVGMGGVDRYTGHPQELVAPILPSTFAVGNGGDADDAESLELRRRRVVMGEESTESAGVRNPAGGAQTVAAMRLPRSPAMEVLQGSMTA